jgi:hypothetical protein
MKMTQTRRFCDFCGSEIGQNPPEHIDLKPDNVGNSKQEIFLIHKGHSLNLVPSDSESGAQDFCGMLCLVRFIRSAQLGLNSQVFDI